LYFLNIVYQFSVNILYSSYYYHFFRLMVPVPLCLYLSFSGELVCSAYVMKCLVVKCKRAGISAMCMWIASGCLYWMWLYACNSVVVFKAASRRLMSTWTHAEPECLWHWTCGRSDWCNEIEGRLNTGAKNNEKT